MKRLLAYSLVLVALSTHAAMADHISLYSDASGASCVLAPGANRSVAVIEKYSVGATGSRFSMTTGANVFLSFNTPYTAVGNLTSDITISYGECLIGSFVIGTATMNLIGGYLYIHPAQLQTQVLYMDCLFVAHKASWGHAVIGNVFDPCNVQVAAEPETWGAIKALYR